MIPSIVPRLTCNISDIDVSEILRKDPGDVSDIVDSIRDNLAKGLPALIHPVVVDGKMRLISGSRRLAAHKALGLTEIDYAFFAVLDDGERVRLEVAANYQKGFTWQERVLGVDKYHRFYQTQAHLKGEDWGVRETGKILGMARNPVHRAVVIAEYLRANDKEVWDALTMQDAFRVLVKREEEALSRKLVAQTLPKTLTPPKTRPSGVAEDIDDEDFFDLGGEQGGFTPAIGGPVSTNERPTGEAGTTTIPLSSMFFKSSGPLDLSVLEGLGEGCCDHIVTDPPYGVEDHIETINQGDHFADAADIADEHISEETAAMMTRFYPLAVRALRDRGFIIMWCDPVFWWQHCCAFADLGLSVQRWPLIWHKTSACMNMAAQYNFTKNIEFAVVARKTNSTLVLPQKSCIWTGGNDIETKLLGHPFAKPFGLWEWVYKAICVRGAEVLDPFVGKGSSVLPAITLGLKPRGIECSEKHYDGLIVNVQQKYKSMDPSCNFS